MAGNTMRLRNPAGHRGLLSSLLAAANGVATFVESRLGLLGQEAKSALVHILVLVVCLLVAELFCIIGFIFLIASAIVGLAQALHVSWIWIALAVSLVDFVLALVFVLIARSR